MILLYIRAIALLIETSNDDNTTYSTNERDTTKRNKRDGGELLSKTCRERTREQERGV